MTAALARCSLRQLQTFVGLILTGRPCCPVEERAKYQKDLVSYDIQNPGYSASLGGKKTGASKPPGAKRAPAQRKSAAVAGPNPIKQAVQFYIDEKVRKLQLTGLIPRSSLRKL